MTGLAGSTPSEPESNGGAPLRLRLWLASLGGVAGLIGGLAWIFLAPGLEQERDVLRLQVAAACGGALFIALLLALWLDRGIVPRVRRLVRRIRGLDASGLHDPAGVHGWGELSELELRLAALIGRHRQAARAADQLQLLERQIEGARASVDRWIESERWTGIPPAPGTLQGLFDGLNRGFARQAEVLDQNREAARQVRDELAGAIAGSREAAEQSERGFVEATSLLTTVRELQRLAADLDARAGAPPEPVPVRSDAWLEPVADALTELVESAGESVDHLASGLSRVQEIADQVHVLGNRSTLVALNALLLAPRAGEANAEIEASTAELRQLGREARAATDRVQELAREVDVQVRAASDRMKGVRQRVAERLSKLEAPTATAGSLDADSIRLLDRVREMVQDATRKAERLSVAGERASRSAERLARKLDENQGDLEGLVVRLSPPSDAAEPAHGMRHAGEETGRRLSVVDRTPAGDAPDLEHGAGEASELGEEHP